jgi:hypothetical protein
VFGIDNLSGKIIWSFIVDGARPFEVYNQRKKPHYPLFVLRSTRHYPYPALCALLVKLEDSNSGLIIFNPITGNIERNIKLGYQVKQVSSLHQLDEEFIRGVILLDTNNNVHVYPDSSKKLAASLAETTYIYVVDPETSTVEGFSLAYSNKQDLIATKIWDMNLGQNGDKIVAVVSKSPYERVHSQGRVLSDRSVLYKYVNPNLVAVVTEGQHPAHKSKLTFNVHIDLLHETIDSTDNVFL